MALEILGFLNAILQFDLEEIRKKNVTILNLVSICSNNDTHYTSQKKSGIKLTPNFSKFFCR